MKYNKGFAPVVILLIVLGVLAVGGVVYFAGKSSAPKNEVSDNSNYYPPVEQNQNPPTTNNNPSQQQTPPSTNNNSTTPQKNSIPKKESGTGIWAPGLYKVEITKNSIPTISTNCCGGWIDGGNGGSGYIQSGETRYAIYGAGNSTNYIDVYFILGPESSFPSPVIDPNNIITSTQNEFNVNYFQLARVNINQTVILNNNNVSIKLKFIERTGTQGCPAGTAC